MLEVQKSGPSGKIERIDEPQASSSKPRKAYVLGVAFVAVLLLGASLGIIIKGSPASAPPTIIDWEGLEAYKINGIRYANIADPDSIQDAIYDTTGGVVVIPSGSYTLTGSIYLHSNMALIGNPKSTILYTAENLNTIYINDSSNHVVVSGLRIIGDGRSSGHATQGIVGYGIQNCTIQDNYLSDFPNDPIILGTDARYNTIQNNRVESCAEGIELISGANHNLITGNIVSSSGDGIELSGFAPSGLPNLNRNNNNTISNNIINQCDVGVYLYFNCSDDSITGNIISGTGSSTGITMYTNNNNYRHRGILMSSNQFTNHDIGILGASALHSNNFVISNNYFEKSKTYGIYFPIRTNNTKITGNYFLNTGGGTNSHVIDISTWNADISGNTIINTIDTKIQYGIQVWCDDLMFNNNYLRLNATYGMMIYSSNSTFSGNTVKAIITNLPSDHAGMDKAMNFHVGSFDNIVIGCRFHAVYGIQNWTNAGRITAIGCNFMGCGASLSGAGTTLINCTGP